jgi:hypothetical protein
MPSLWAKCDGEWLRVTPGLHFALMEVARQLGLAHAAYDPENAAIWQAGRAHVSDLGSTTGVKFSAGAYEDFDGDGPAFDVLGLCVSETEGPPDMDPKDWPGSLPDVEWPGSSPELAP